jgi:hypothetical protein
MEVLDACFVGLVDDISPEGTEMDLEVQHPMDGQVDAHLEGEGSNFNAEILTENILEILKEQPVREALASSLLKHVETGSYEIVKKQFQKLNYPIMVWMGYEVGKAKLHDRVNLTNDLKKSI